MNLNGFEYRSTVAVMGGKYMIGISAAVREACGLQGGDPIRVVWALPTLRAKSMCRATSPRPAADPEAAAFFAGLSNSLQRYHVDLINTAKSTDTRRRRVEKAIALFREGRKRSPRSDEHR